MKVRFPPLEDMVVSGRILKKVLLYLKKAIRPGITTQSLDILAAETIKSFGAIPAFLGYHNFPAVCCISVNDEVVHAIPNSRVLCDGDIVSVDCGVSKNGAITDSCRTFYVGTRVSKQTKRLVRAAKVALAAGIKESVVGNRIGDISFAIQKSAELSNFNVCREFVGHTIGYKLHEEPYIPNYGRKSSGNIIEMGMFLAIEPILFDGPWKVKERSDGSYISYSGNLSAHFEDTIYISENGPIVLT
jgi:methionyl aminopeptidase